MVQLRGSHVTGGARTFIAVVLSLVLAAVGAAQPIGLFLAFSRIVDPGWPAFDAIGTVAGLGMALVAATVTTFSPSRRPRLVTLFGAVATVAGLVSMGVWLSLWGRTFYTNDVPRVAALAATDVAFTVWILAGARYADRGLAASGMARVAWVMTVRVVVELALVRPVVFPAPTNPGASANVLPVLAGGMVLLGYLVLGLWEIAVGLWLRRPR